MTDPQQSSWTRALMASSGISLGHEGERRHESAEWHEASAHDTPLARLQKLAVSRDSAVRYIVARRQDSPMGVLSSLAFDGQPDVRAAVAGNPRITEAIAEHLARDRDANVLKVLARNDAISLALLERLSLHRKEDVRRVAARQLDARAAGFDGSTRAADPIVVAAHPDGLNPGRLPAELVDRVAPMGPWLHEASDVDPRRRDWEPQQVFPLPPLARGAFS